MAAFGAFGLGLVIGWMVYFTNRYRAGAVQFSDITSVLGIVGGAAVTALFGDAKTVLFGAYGLGLAAGFFLYFIALIILVKNSGGEFTWTWFLDGRRKKPNADDGWEIPSGTRETVAPMDLQPSFSNRLRSLENAVTSLAPAARPMALPAPPAGPSPLAQAGAEKDTAIADVRSAIMDLDVVINATSDDAQRTALRRKSEELSEKLTELVALRLRDILEGAETQAALAKLRAITGDLKVEAAKIKQTADALNAAAKVISQVTRLIGFLGGGFA